MKNQTAIEIEAGLIIGELRNRGFNPVEAQQVLILATVYMIENMSKNRKMALEAVIASIKAEVEVTSVN